MITLAQLLDGFAHETHVIKFLATQIPEGGMDYRPTPGQRSTEELLRYMTRMAIVPMARAVDGDWQRGEVLERQAEGLDLADFAGEMDRQLGMLREEAGTLEGRDLETEACTMPWHAPCTLGEFLVNAVYKTFVAYRMQLFLYAKAAGAHDLGPAQCWVGVEPPPQPA